MNPLTLPRLWPIWCGALTALTLTAGVLSWWLVAEDAGDPALRAFVHSRPPVSVVFTSRSNAASLEAAAPEGQGFHHPGQPLWQAAEGRLRLLTPTGAVRELTWQKPLPDGSTLIDVMSPSVSPDGRRVIFAGRKQEGHGRFRLYEVGVDGTGLRPITGRADDPGCTALPPLRFAADGSLLSAQERQTTDYDDVDPVYLFDGRVAFVSSRLPDLGRGHARRSTQVWIQDADGLARRPITANRNNDRWPFLQTSQFLAFSLWSRNTEVITADERDIQPWQEGMTSATHPTDSWLGAVIDAGGDHFGFLVKTSEPVWRPRPLFNGRIAFMTPGERREGSEVWAGLRVAQADVGLIGNVPSARPADQPLPHQQGGHLIFGPRQDAAGQPMSLATPSPCPENHVLLAGAVVDGAATGFGIYLAADDWPTAEPRGLRLLFDDPQFVDAEPVAVYRRAPQSGSPTADTDLAGSRLSGRFYGGPAGQAIQTILFHRSQEDMPGQATNTGARPMFDAPPPDSIDHLRLYISHRDRFDDPHQPRIPGGWELLLRVPVKDSSLLDPSLMTGSPAVLAGFGRDGRVARWTTAARDSQGRQATMYAFAGDHYSISRPGLFQFCRGCHPGHSHLGSRSHAE